MTKGAECLNDGEMAYDNSSGLDSKRSHQWFMDGQEAELFPNKKQAVNALRIEQKAGRVFKGWEEGSIYFALTYKYRFNSDHYVAQTYKSKEKPRTPAWCDRILWKGEGMKQLFYNRGESRFSDHRPAYSLFSVKVNAGIKHIPRVKSCPPKIPTSASLSSSGLAKVQAGGALGLGYSQNSELH